MALSLFKKPEKVISRESLAKTRPESFSASEIRSGFLVTASVVCLLVLLFLAGKSQLFKNTYQVRILFNFVSGLAKNAPVHFAGHEVGTVSDVRLSSEEEGQVVVTATIAKEARLRKDSQAFIDLLGFMGEKFLELTPGSAQAPFLQTNETLRGTDPVALSEMMKQGREVAQELEKTTVSLQNLIQNLNQVVGENRQDLSVIFDNLNASSENLKEMTHDLKLHPWKLLKKGKEAGTDGKKKGFYFF